MGHTVRTQAVALLTPEEAARELAVSTKHLRNLTEIPYVNIGVGTRERRRYKPEDLEAFIEARSKTPCQPTSGTVKSSTPMTSVIVGIDFQARRTAKASVKPTRRKPR